MNARNDLCPFEIVLFTRSFVGRLASQVYVDSAAKDQDQDQGRES